ncbi:MAG: DUF488 family protein [Bacteroidota bacterium]|jgi:uncharacterized protein (DUF488 family)|nr:DUF488 domain-containing protein [Ignavibacteria bacterium]MCU7497641.1 DUF488 domain-containing protein [Ignavibacteria bacterium]MCU7511054.1 DUF488 domain-containing protein [Ignavibacteria bacterium]MCU7518908.1 DUF488 domain-containing protein [Ignavibacteria bacterium]MCU7523124.1 DUF488 domain-containing protein [Ignavibacteria bacterium]
MKSSGNIKIFTIGFTKKNAEKFFNLLTDNKVKRVIDIRLNNTSQLAGYAKAEDLKYFLKAVAGIEYTYLTELAPTQEIMDEAKKNKGDRKVFEKSYIALISKRKVEQMDIKELLDGSCLLCSEDRPDECHRKLASEYLKKKWGNVEIVHLF